MTSEGGAAPLPARRVALVTGGTRGIGRGIALRFARDGADCAFTYRTQAELARRVGAEIEALGRRTLALPLDLDEPARVPAVVLDTDSARLYFERGLGVGWDAAARRIARTTPMRRLGTVEDVASLVAYLASDAASFLTGQTILLDGGLTITSPLQRLSEVP